MTSILSSAGTEAIELLFGKKNKLDGRGLGIIEFDATLSETHRKLSTVTEHPVEVGAAISDHIRPNAEEIDIVGIVTNHPVIFAAGIQNAISPLQGSPNSPKSSKRSVTADNILRDIMNSGSLVDIVTSLRDYKDMAITSFICQREAASSNILHAQLTLRHIFIATRETLDRKTGAAKGTTKTGAQADNKASPEQAAKADKVMTSPGTIGHMAVTQ